MAFPYLEFISSFLVLVFIVERWLDWRQWKCYQKITTVPVQVREWVSEDKFHKSKDYGQTHLLFGVVDEAFSLVHLFAILYFHGLPWLWNFSLSILERFDLDQSYEISRALVFLLFASVESTVVSLPFSIFKTFVIEEKFGFNKQTPMLFLTDIVKSFILQIVIGGPIIAGILFLIGWGGQYFYIYVWIFQVVVTLIMLTIYPTLIAPLFNKFDPLPEGELREGIEGLAKKVKFPLTKLFVVDGSKRSAHSNAYFYGFFKNKRIVLYDTLIEQVPETKGILAIVAHEMGHYCLNHTIKNLVISQMYTLSWLFLFGTMLGNKDLFLAFGFDTTPIFIGLVLFSMLYSPVDHVLSLMMNALSRRFEYQADEFAAKFGFDITEPLTRIHMENLGNLCPDSLYSAYHNSHPTLIERIDAVHAAAKRSH